MKVQRALIFSFLDRGASLGVTIISSMVLARLLAPAEIGIYSVVMVLMAFVSTWRDFGAGQYLVQEAELTPQRIRAVWTVQLGLGALLALLTLGASWPVAAFYGEPRMHEIMLLIALGYLVNPFGSITYAWLMRGMRFEALTLMRLSATLAGAATSIACATQGLGAISLAWGSLASIAANALVALCFRPQGFPLLPGLQEVGRVLRFGTRMTSSSLMETAAQGAPELLLGKLQDMSTVGLFSRANGLINLFARLVSDSVNVVALAMFARQQREGGDVAGAFVRGNSYVAAVGWSFAGFVALLADPLIRVLYGSQWDASIPVTRWLALAMSLTIPSALCFQVLVGAGASAKLPKTMAMASAALIAAAAAGAPFGAQALAIGLCAGSVLASAVWLRVTTATLGVAGERLAQGLARSLLLALLANAPALLVVLLLGWRPAQPLLALVLGTAGVAMAFVGAALATRHPIADELRGLALRLRPAR